MRTRPTVSFVVPVRNDAERLGVCLRSMRMNTHGGAPIELIVVDNGSVDRSPDVARKVGATVITIEGSGVSHLRNVGAAQATGEILAFVDADHEISSTWVAAAVNALAADNVAAAGALCHAPLEGTWVQRAYGALRGVPRGQHDVEWLGSGNMAVRRSVFEAVGGFDTSLVTCEDVDLCNRIRATGARIVSDARMKNVHYGDPGTLWDVFKGELWRGQDNLRVSLRSRLTWRGLPSVVIPIVDVVMLIVAVLGLAFGVAGWRSGLVATATALLVVTAGAALRVGRALARERRFAALGVLQALAVACVYDVARAVSLLVRPPHRNARPQTVTAQ